MACIEIDIIIESPIELEGTSTDAINAPIEINTPIILNPTEPDRYGSVRCVLFCLYRLNGQ